MLTRLYVFFLAWFSTCSLQALTQRSYLTNSILSAGAWYKISVSDPGIYKIDIPLLNSLGVNTNNLNSNSIRLFGNGGQMLAEANGTPRQDDLRENAILVVDGGDGIINGSDYILFYASGPDEWVKDSANLRFSHRKNVFSDKSYYFLSVGEMAGALPMPRRFCLRI